MSTRVLFWFKGALHANIVVDEVPRIGETVKALGDRPLRVTHLEWDVLDVVNRKTGALPEANVFLDFVPGMAP